MDLGIKNELKIDQKSSKKVIENQMRCWMDLGRLLERFGMDFGPKLGAKLEPSWHQNPKNDGAKDDVKRCNVKGHAGEHKCMQE